MNTAQARRILEQLLEGVHPLTGEILPADHVCAEPEIIRALHKAIQALDQASPPPPQEQQAKETQKSKSSGSRTRTKAPWTEKEDQYLREQWQAGQPVEEIAKQVKRNTRTVSCRLVYLDIAPRSILPGMHPIIPGKEHIGLPWYPEDEERINNLHLQGLSPLEISRLLKRTENGIIQHMIKMGIIKVQQS